MFKRLTQSQFDSENKNLQKKIVFQFFFKYSFSSAFQYTLTRKMRKQHNNRIQQNRERKMRYTKLENMKHKPICFVSNKCARNKTEKFCGGTLDKWTIGSWLCSYSRHSYIVFFPRRFNLLFYCMIVVYCIHSILEFRLNLRREKVLDTWVEFQFVVKFMFWVDK